jgi:hypothetical protein
MPFFLEQIDYSLDETVNGNLINMYSADTVFYNWKPLEHRWVTEKKTITLHKG